MDADKAKRRFYVCLHCPKVNQWHMNQKYRMTAHVYKQHLATDKAPYYCNLCLFRSTTREALDSHVTSYRRHALAASLIRGPVDHQKYLVANRNPTMLAEGVDFRVATPEEVITRCPSRVDDPLDMDELIGAGDIGNSSGLISVQLTPEMLTRLLDAQAGTRVPIYDPTQPGYAPALSSASVGDRSAFRDVAPRNDGFTRTRGLSCTPSVSQEMYTATSLTVPTVPTVTCTPTAPRYCPTRISTPVLQIPPVGGMPITSGAECDATAGSSRDNRVVRALSTLSTPELNSKSILGTRQYCQSRTLGGSC